MSAEIPSTGDAAIDAALHRVDLTGPVEDHHDQLAAALDALQAALADTDESRQA